MRSTGWARGWTRRPDDFIDADAKRYTNAAEANEAVLKHIVENEVRTWCRRCVSLAGLGRGAEGEGEKGD